MRRREADRRLAEAEPFVALALQSAYRRWTWRRELRRLFPREYARLRATP